MSLNQSLFRHSYKTRTEYPPCNLSFNLFNAKNNCTHTESKVQVDGKYSSEEVEVTFHLTLITALSQHSSAISTFLPCELLHRFCYYTISKIQRQHMVLFQEIRSGWLWVVALTVLDQHVSTSLSSEAVSDCKSWCVSVSVAFNQILQPSDSFSATLQIQSCE